MSDTSEADRPGGAPRSAYSSKNFLAAHADAVEALGSLDRALVFQRLAFRCQRSGTWKATLAEIASQCHLSQRTTQRVLKHLRDIGWVESQRASSWDSTQVWQVCWQVDEIEAPNQDKLRHKRDGQNGHLVMAKMATSHMAKMAMSPSIEECPPPSLRRPGRESNESSESSGSVVPFPLIGSTEPDAESLAELRRRVQTRPPAARGAW